MPPSTAGREARHYIFRHALNRSKKPLIYTLKLLPPFGTRQTFLNDVRDGGAEGSRTPDLFIANEALYQLSYDPIHRGNCKQLLRGKSRERRCSPRSLAKRVADIFIKSVHG